VKGFAVTFTRREVALTLRIVMQSTSTERLATATGTAAPDLRRIAAGRLAPTVRVLSYLGFRSSGRNYAWQFESRTDTTKETR
jgi:hypothetical protein